MNNMNPNELTAETVTDDQIKALRTLVTPIDSLVRLWHDCNRALAQGGYREERPDPLARQRCAAAAINRIFGPGAQGL